MSIFIGIMVPHNEKGTYDLNYGIENLKDISTLHIGNIARKLWDIGFFDNLGKELGIYFSECEDDWIQDREGILGCLNVVNRYIAMYPDFTELIEIKDIFLKAQEYETSIDFYL